MIPLFAPTRVRELDQRTIAAGTSALELMERAAGALARVVLTGAGRSYGLRVALLCGKGNNGGDGIAAARRLLRAGAAPVVWLAAEEEELSAETAVQLARWRAEGGRVAATAAESLRGADLAVDCLLGTGAGGAPRGAVAAAISELNAAGLPVVACDLPSGVDAATGAVPGQAVQAAVTLTIGAEKAGLRLWPARGHCGRLLLADIGILSGGEQPDAMVLEHADAAGLLGALPPDAEKRTRGMVLVVAGGPGMAGAAVLSARGALAAGAGLVTVAAPPEVLPVVTGAVPAALTLALPADAHGAAKAILERAAESDAVVLGPGRGLDTAVVETTRQVVRECLRPLVLDADGLNVFRHDGAALAEHASPLLALTPHRRELARLIGEDRWEERFHQAARLAGAWDAVVVVKGPGTVIAAPDGRRWVNPTGGPALATGGTGDVLAGVLGTLLAQRPDAGTVAAGVHAHGLAGEIAQGEHGARGAGALELADALGAAFRTLEEAA